MVYDNGGPIFRRADGSMFILKLQSLGVCNLEMKHETGGGLMTYL